MKLSKGKNIFYYLFNLILIFASVLFLFPLFWMLSGAFRPESQVLEIPPIIIPIPPSFANIVKLFAMSNIFRWLFNSIFISSLTSFAVIILATMAGYSLAKKKFAARDFIFYAMVLTMMIPKQILLVPVFGIVNKFNLFDSYAGLILPALGWPFGLFLMRQFCVTIPNELLEAANIDGCGEIRTFINVVMPIVKPGIGALAIFTFIDSWNDYMWQLLVIKSSVMSTLPLGIANIQQRYSTRYGVLMAGAVLASLPMVICFLMFQKYFTKGITIGAVKG